MNAGSLFLTCNFVSTRSSRQEMYRRCENKLQFPGCSLKGTDQCLRYRSRRPAVGLVGPFRSNTRFHHGNRVASKPLFPKNYRGVLTRTQPCIIQGTTLESKLQCGLAEAP